MSWRRTTTTWLARAPLAIAVRVALVVTPFVAGWLAIRLTQSFFVRPAGRPGLLVWVVQAAAVSAAVSMLASRLLQRLAPLPALLAMTLVFPDHAPSRFRLALRAGSTAKLLAADDIALSSNLQEAAEQAIGLVNELSRHERLTRGHSERVRAKAELIGQQLELPDEEMQRLRWGVLLHDIGKLKVGSEILRKPGEPTAEEWELLRRHPGEAVELLAPLRPWLGDWVLAASQHHERWDGSGYPAGLAGTDISLPGRIAAVADAYDVMTSRRSYKAPTTIDAARRELVASAGSHFDPAIVRALLEASLREPRRANPFGWLLEIPSVARIANSAVTAPLAIATAVAVVALPLAEPGAPDLAFAEPTTTTTAVSTPGTTGTPTTPSTQGQGAPPASSSSSAATTTRASTSTQPSASTDATDPSIAPPPTATIPPTSETTTTAPASTSPTSTTTTIPPTPCELARSGQTDLPGQSLVGCDLGGLVIDGLNFDGADLRNVNLASASIVNFTIIGADLSGANLTGLSLTDGSLVGSELPGVPATGIALTRVDLGSVSWPGAALDNATMVQVGFSMADLTGASWRWADVSTSQIQDAILTDADLRDSTLASVGFDRSNLVRADFTGATFDSVTGGAAIHQNTICPNGTPTDTSCF